MTKDEALKHLLTASEVVHQIAMGKITIIDLMPLAMAAADEIEDALSFIEDLKEPI